MRAIGLSPSQLTMLISLETLILGSISGLLAIPAGIVQAWIMIFIINKRSFGWSLDLYLDPPVFIQALCIAILAAVIAGIYPALRISKVSPALALKEVI